MFRLSALLSLSCAMLVAGCGVSAPESSTMRDVVRNTSHKVEMRVEGEAVAGQMGSIILTVTQNGQPVDLVSQQRSFHVVVASENLGDLYHTFSPDRWDTGVYRVRHVFGEAGRYRVRVEIDDETKPKHHYGEADLIAEGDLTVGGTDAGEADWLVQDAETTVSGYRVKLVHTPLKAGQPGSFSFEIRDPSGATVSQVSSPEGVVVEPAIYVIVGRGFSHMEHGHPTDPSGTRGGTPITLPVAGEYLLWTEFYPAAAGQPEAPFAIPFRLRVLP